MEYPTSVLCEFKAQDSRWRSP